MVPLRGSSGRGRCGTQSKSIEALNVAQYRTESQVTQAKILDALVPYYTSAQADAEIAANGFNAGDYYTRIQCDNRYFPNNANPRNPRFSLWSATACPSPQLRRLRFSEFRGFPSRFPRCFRGGSRRFRSFQVLRLPRFRGFKFLGQLGQGSRLLNPYKFRLYSKSSCLFTQRLVASELGRRAGQFVAVGVPKADLGHV